MDALELPRQHSGAIDILLTDAVMPEFRRPELARQVQDRHPNIHVNYMSGYAEAGMDQATRPKRHSSKNHFVLQRSQNSLNSCHG
ncbi:MAG: hypothetical protein WBW14_11430, partial [Candidatus Acidiferrum sp.]